MSPASDFRSGFIGRRWHHGHKAFPLLLVRWEARRSVYEQAQWIGICIYSKITAIIRRDAQLGISGHVRRLKFRSCIQHR